MSIFWKIYTVVFCVFIVMIGILAYIISSYEISDKKGRIIENNSLIGGFMAKEIEKGYLESNWPFESLRKMSERDDFLFWWIVRDDGTIYLADKASFMMTNLYDYFPQITKMKEDGGTLLNRRKNYGVFVKPVEMGKKKWLFLLGFSTKEVLEIRRRVIFAAVFISVITSGVIGAILYMAVNHFTGPIKHLSRSAAIIGNGDLTHRVKIKSHDEIGLLADSFNKMTEDLKRTTTSISNLNKEIEERKRAEEKIRRQKDFIEKTINALKYPFYVVNPDYTVALANDSAREKGIAEGRHCYQVTHRTRKPCEDKQVCFLREVVRRGEPIQAEHVHYDKDNNEMYMEVYAAPIFDKDGRVIQMIEYAVDITERKKAEGDRERLIRTLEENQILLSKRNRELEDSRRAIKNVAMDLEKSKDTLEEQKSNLEEINKELDDFTYIVSHDLREPLRSIDAYSKFIADDCKDMLGEEGINFLNRIRANAGRMQELIENLLEISRIERRKSLFEEVGVGELIDDVKLRLEYTIKQKDAEIIVRDTLPRIFCDRVRLTEVFINLVSNAIKFTDERTPRVEIGFSQEGNFYKFYVKDNGPGIEEQYFEKIFGIFQRLGRKGEHEGTGAGLTIVRKIIHMHKGKIWVESKIGEGTTFYFTIPREKEVIFGKKKIGQILVEKNLVSQEDIKRALKEQGGMT